MHIFQSKNGSQPTSPAQHQPFPLFILVSKEPLLPTYLPSTPTRPAAQTSLPRAGIREGNVGRGIESEKSEEHQDQTESHLLMPPPSLMPLLHPPLPQKHQRV